METDQNCIGNFTVNQEQLNIDQNRTIFTQLSEKILRKLLSKFNQNLVKFDENSTEMWIENQKNQLNENRMVVMLYRDLSRFRWKFFQIQWNFHQNFDSDANEIIIQTQPSLLFVFWKCRCLTKCSFSLPKVSKSTVDFYLVSLFRLLKGVKCYEMID